jgi:hypothetical protein
MPQKLTQPIIEAAIKGYLAQKAEIDSQIAELKSMLDGGSKETAAMPSETGKPRKKFSAATRRKMAAAQRARYSKLRQGSEPTEAATTKPKKRKMSAAGRKAISIATKKRWAAINAAKKTA